MSLTDIQNPTMFKFMLKKRLEALKKWYVAKGQPVPKYIEESLAALEKKEN